MPIQRIHHVAYRCHDAKATVQWYQQHLGMNFVLAIAEGRVPSTHAPDPCMHVFPDAGAGHVLAFFELPNSAPMGRDSNTPELASKLHDVKWAMLNEWAQTQRPPQPAAWMHGKAVAA